LGLAATVKLLNAMLVPEISDRPLVLPSLLKFDVVDTWISYWPDVLPTAELQLKVSEVDWSVAPFVGDESEGAGTSALALIAHAIRQVADRAALFHLKRDITHPFPLK